MNLVSLDHVNEVSEGSSHPHATPHSPTPLPIDFDGKGLRMEF